MVRTALPFRPYFLQMLSTCNARTRHTAPILSDPLYSKNRQSSSLPGAGIQRGPLYLHSSHVSFHVSQSFPLKHPTTLFQITHETFIPARINASFHPFETHPDHTPLFRCFAHTRFHRSNVHSSCIVKFELTLFILLLHTELPSVGAPQTVQSRRNRSASPLFRSSMSKT